MSATRVVILASLLTLTAFAFVSGVEARPIPPQNIGCGGDTVELCFPTCVTDPCPQYVCLHTDAGSVCREISR